MEENNNDIRHEGDIAISSRVRLARNLNSIPFPNRMSSEQGKAIINDAWEIVSRSSDSMADNMAFLLIKDMNAIERQLLVEKHLISPDLCNTRNDSAVIISKDEKISIMINEEDHLRIQCIFPGMQLEESWRLCNKLDLLFEEKLDFAFDKNLGYLTCCPTNIGTGMRASVMLHLPALTMTGYIKNILETCSKLGIAVRGIYGENSEASGNMYQISNQVSIGQTEEEIIASVENVASQIIDQERIIRKELYSQNPNRFEDRVFRSLGILSNARIISSEESLKLLSDVRLGIDMNTIKGIAAETINDILLMIQPACMQKVEGKLISPEERDIKRAEIIRNKLSN